MRANQNGNHASLFFDSLTELIDYNAAGPDYRSKEMREYGNHSFYGARDMQHAYEIARKGLPSAGLAAIDFASATQHDMPLKTVSFDTYMDTAGAYVDMGRYVSGEPECMVAYELAETEQVRPIITLVVSVSHNAYITSESIERRGRAIVALIQAIVTTGAQVEVWTDDQTRASGVTCRTAVRLKTAGGLFDVSAFMYALTHDSYLRSVMFHTMHHLPARWVKAIGCPSSYGAAITGATHMEEFPEGAIYIDSLTDNRDPEGCTRKVLDKLGLLRK
ncbi:hypothetical protein SEA_LUMOS_132 [Mycobacterium phage Lumos]|uniref:DUF7192 domain-containing protein n=1 Tax=Mycobacterium phage Lumos TaxID=1701852 RepID=A0A0K2CMN8_9CAUD|nr:hypothetical protein AVU96_gp058 [Mycobacterium phage Snenia]YP_010012580.1 hypothetical protein J4T93_gp056 [Mycobacterium phage Lumos]ALA06638.1 hypothetical protein SEA_LUMOS_132 [Mycobacterium phage Lumos]ALF01577.1 hypothetical protein SNENIA_131 [Mycobacterium phage Snenia]QDF16704.1 hypothetical protein PBI_MSGREEN_133 [Mycobacterium phage MsGreen]